MCPNDNKRCDGLDSTLCKNLHPTRRATTAKKKKLSVLQQLSYAPRTQSVGQFRPQAKSHVLSSGNRAQHASKQGMVHAWRTSTLATQSSTNQQNSSKCNPPCDAMLCPHTGVGLFDSSFGFETKRQIAVATSNITKKKQKNTN